MSLRKSSLWRSLSNSVRHYPLLLATLAALLVGALAFATGALVAAKMLWVGGACLGIVLSLVTTLRSVAKRRVGVDGIALIALVGATVIGEYFAAAVVSVMLATGYSLERWAGGRARHELELLLNRAPKSARRFESGELRTVQLEDVAPGDRLLVATGEVVPVDGLLELSGAVLDESALTGESRPVERAAGERIASGVLNGGAPFNLLALTSAAESTYAGVVRLVAEAERSQTPTVRLADRFALGFLGAALATAALGWLLGGPSRAVAVLVVATPCPLILAAPIAFIAGLSRCASRGVIVKSGAVLERLANCKTMLIDKTGTVTAGRATLTQTFSSGQYSAKEVLQFAASLDQLSPHVLAAAVVRAALDQQLELTMPVRTAEVFGQGIRGQVGDHQVKVGKSQWALANEETPWVREARACADLDGATTVFVAVDERAVGVLVLSDPVRPDAKEMLASLRSRGIDRIVMVTGDRALIAKSVADQIGVDELFAELSPGDKVEVVRQETVKSSTLMVGDGINDAPALALADVGVALGARGATAASQAADAVLMVEDLGRIGEAFSSAQRSLRIAVQSMVAGMTLSLIAMVAATVGWLPVVAGAALQEVIDAAVILNALRALRAEKLVPK